MVSGWTPSLWLDLMGHPATTCAYPYNSELQDSINFAPRASTSHLSSLFLLQQTSYRMWACTVNNGDFIHGNLILEGEMFNKVLRWGKGVIVTDKWELCLEMHGLYSKHKRTKECDMLAWRPRIRKTIFNLQTQRTFQKMSWKPLKS